MTEGTWSCENVNDLGLVVVECYGDLQWFEIVLPLILVVEERELLNDEGVMTGCTYLYCIVGEL